MAEISLTLSKGYSEDTFLLPLRHKTLQAKTYLTPVNGM